MALFIPSFESDTTKNYICFISTCEIQHSRPSMLIQPFTKHIFRPIYDMRTIRDINDIQIFIINLNIRIQDSNHFSFSNGCLDLALEAHNIKARDSSCRRQNYTIIQRNRKDKIMVKSGAIPLIDMFKVRMFKLMQEEHEQE